jgi:uncharacterized protein YjiS (DUF1127 family)
MTTAYFDATHLPALAEQSAPLRPASLTRTLRDLLAKKDDRLLRDIGLTREDILGLEETAQADWRRTRETWSL